MKTACVLVWFACLTALISGGCVSHSAVNRKATFAVTVTVQGQKPSPQQRQAAIAQYLPVMQAHGWSLVSDSTAADEILHLNFVPDLLDPQHKGEVTLLGVTRHTRPRTPIYASSGYAYSSPLRDNYFLWSSGYYADRYWYNPYGREYYGGGDNTTTPPPPKNPPGNTPPPTTPPTSPGYHKPNLHSTDFRPRPLPQNDSGSNYSPPSYPSGSSDYSSGSASSSGSFSSSSSSDSGASSFSSSSAYSSSSDSGGHYPTNTGRSAEK